MDPVAAEKASAYRAERAFQESSWTADAYNRDAIEREKQANRTLAERVAVLEEQVQRLLSRES